MGTSEAGFGSRPPLVALHPRHADMCGDIESPGGTGDVVVGDAIKLLCRPVSLKKAWMEIREKFHGARGDA